MWKLSSEEKVNKQSEEERRGSELNLKRLQTRSRDNERGNQERRTVKAVNSVCRSVEINWD